MLHDVLVPEDEKIDIHHSIPDIHYRWDTFNIKRAQTPFVKTHFAYQSAYQKVVYLVRDPIDLIYSLWHYVRLRERKKNISLDELINQLTHQGWLYGGWDSHITSYLQSGLNQDDLLVLRYEHMVADPLSVLKQVLDFSGFDVDKSLLTDVVVKHMDKRLSKTGLCYETYEQKTHVLSSLQLGKGYHYLKPKQIEQLKSSNLGQVALKLGYTLDIEDSR